jgi:hypothetical protein
MFSPANRASETVTKKIQGTNNQYVQAKSESAQNEHFQKPPTTAESLAVQYGTPARLNNSLVMVSVCGRSSSIPGNV